MWKIDGTSIDRKINRLASNADLMRRYNQFLDDLGELKGSDDPARLGEKKIGRHRGSFGYRLTKSHRLLFRVDYERKVVFLVDIGDHKEVYGKD